jgi:hypothetical protein
MTRKQLLLLLGIATVAHSRGQQHRDSLIYVRV